MAKRRRLSPARGLELGPEGMPEVERFARETSPDQAPAAGIETKSLPPIAAMAGDISRRAAIEEMAASLEIARHEGRLAEALPLDA
ncbi:MAG: nuclease, partial [Jannaschia sp.]